MGSILMSSHTFNYLHGIYLFLSIYSPYCYFLKLSYPSSRIGASEVPAPSFFVHAVWPHLQPAPCCLLWWYQPGTRGNRPAKMVGQSKLRPIDNAHQLFDWMTMQQYASGCCSELGAWWPKSLNLHYQWRWSHALVPCQLIALPQSWYGFICTAAVLFIYLWHFLERCKMGKIR